MYRTLRLLLLCLPLAATAAEALRIGVSGPFTGGSAPMGISMRNGIRLAAAEINRSGGIRGRPLLLIERDDMGRSDIGIRIAKELTLHQRVIASVGFVNSGVALASQGHYQQAGIPAITAVATAPQVTEQFAPPKQPINYVFRVSASDAQQAPLIVREAKRSGLSRLAIFHDKTNYGRTGKDELLKALRQQGLSPVYTGQFRLGERDMIAQLRRARDLGAQAILTYAIGPELAQIANSLAQLDWRPQLIGSWTLSMSNFIDDAGPNAEGARMVQTFISDSADPLRQDFVARYLQTFGGRRIPSAVSAAQGYDSMLLLAATLRHSTSTDGKAIVRALENLPAPVKGVITTYHKPFSASDHDAIDLAVPVIGKLQHGEVVHAYSNERTQKRRP